MLIFADFIIYMRGVMPKMYKYLLLVVLSVLTGAPLMYAQVHAIQTTATDTSIVQYLERSNTGGLVQITQPAELARRVARMGEGGVQTSVKVPIYRIQLFSLNHSNAKAQAEKLAQEVKEQFPDLTANVSYVSPFWRLRVGEYRTYEEANAMQFLIKNKFPDFERGMLIIRERVNVQVRDYSND